MSASWPETNPALVHFRIADEALTGYYLRSRFGNASVVRTFCGTVVPANRTVQRLTAGAVTCPSCRAIADAWQEHQQAQGKRVKPLTLRRHRAFRRAHPEVGRVRPPPPVVEPIVVDSMTALAEQSLLASQLAAASRVEEKRSELAALVRYREARLKRATTRAKRAATLLKTAQRKLKRAQATLAKFNDANPKEG